MAILVQTSVYFWNLRAKTCHLISLRHTYTHAALPFNKVQAMTSLSEDAIEWDPVKLQLCQAAPLTSDPFFLFLEHVPGSSASRCTRSIPASI